jgi:hypothetical protein
MTHGNGVGKRLGGLCRVALHILIWIGVSGGIGFRSLTACIGGGTPIFTLSLK